MVLVSDVQIVENPESCALTILIRFGSVNCIFGALGYAIYSSSALSFVFCGVIPDRERGLLGMGLTVTVNKLVSEVVEGASEVVDNVSNDQPDFSERGLDVEYSVNVISRLRDGLTFDSIGAAVDEPSPDDFQIKEVLLCSFDFDPDERESFVGCHILMLVVIQHEVG